MRVVVDDLASVRVDAIVRAADSRLAPVSPALDNLEKLAGPSFRDIRIAEELAVGSAVVTDGTGVTANLVIHAIVKQQEGPITSQSVARATTSSLHRAVAWELESIAFPPLGSGPDDLSVEDSANLLVGAIGEHDFSLGFPSEILVVVSNDEERSVFERLSEGAL